MVDDNKKVADAVSGFIRTVCVAASQLEHDLATLESQHADAKSRLDAAEEQRRSAQARLSQHNLHGEALQRTLSKINVANSDVSTARAELDATTDSLRDAYQQWFPGIVDAYDRVAEGMREGSAEMIRRANQLLSCGKIAKTLGVTPQAAHQRSLPKDRPHWRDLSSTW